MTDASISPFRRHMIEGVTVHNFAPKTQRYIHLVGTSPASRAIPDTASHEDLRLFQLHLAEDRVGAPTMDSTVSALRSFSA